jgi:hypothetical protein
LNVWLYCSSAARLFSRQPFSLAGFGETGPIATKWNVGGLDRTLYLLDHTGKFKQRIGQREEFEDIIADMVEAAKKDRDQGSLK